MTAKREKEIRDYVKRAKARLHPQSRRQTRESIARIEELLAALADARAPR